MSPTSHHEPRCSTCLQAEKRRRRRRRRRGTLGSVVLVAADGVGEGIRLALTNVNLTIMEIEVSMVKRG